MLKNKNKIWSTKKVEEVIQAIEEGRPADTSCFWNNDMNYRAANINFELTPQEMEEFVKCSQDVIYFANKYAHAMTDEGIRNITLRPYQEKMLRAFQDNRFVVLLASRQIGKCVTFDSEITVKNKLSKEIKKMPLFEFYHMLIKDKLKYFSFKQKIFYYSKYFLYKLYVYLKTA